MKISFQIAGVLVCSVFLSCAQAQENQTSQNNETLLSVAQVREGIDSGIVEQPPGVRQTAETFVRYLPTRSLKAQEGKISVFQSEFEYSYEFKAFGKMPLVISYANEYIALEESGLKANSLPAQLNGQSLGVEATLPFFNVEKTYLRLRVMPSMNTDDWDMHSSAFRIPVHMYAIHQPNERLTLIGGVAVYADSEDRVFPILGVIYKPNDSWAFNIVAPRPNIQYKVNDTVTVFAEVGFADKEFEVKKDSVDGQILRFRQNHCGGGIRYSLNKHVQVLLSSGYAFKRYLKYGDSRGKFNLKNDMYTECRLEVEL